MKKLLFTICLLAATQVKAQITVSQDTVKLVKPKGTSAYLVDTLYNGSISSANVTWSMSNSSTLAPGHVGIGLCFLPGQCYPFNFSSHTDEIPPKSAALYQVDLNISTSSVAGEKSIIILNTDINGGKNLYFILETATSQSTNDLLIDGLTIYPNPVQESLNINWENNMNAIINIVNLQGVIVKSHSVNNVNNAKIDLSSLSNGLYLAQISDEHGNLLASRKITK